MNGAGQNSRQVRGDVRWSVTNAAGIRFDCFVCVEDQQIDVRLMTSDEVVCVKRVLSEDAASGVVRRWLQVVLSDEHANAGIGDNLIAAVH